MVLPFVIGLVIGMVIGAGGMVAVLAVMGGAHLSAHEDQP